MPRSAPNPTIRNRKQRTEEELIALQTIAHILRSIRLAQGDRGSFRSFIKLLIEDIQPKGDKPFSIGVIQAAEAAGRQRTGADSIAIPERQYLNCLAKLSDYGDDRLHSLADGELSTALPLKQLIEATDHVKSRCELSDEEIYTFANNGILLPGMTCKLSKLLGISAEAVVESAIAQVQKTLYPEKDFSVLKLNTKKSNPDIIDLINILIKFMPHLPRELQIVTLLRREQEKQGIPYNDHPSFAVYLEIPLEKLNAILSGQRTSLEPNELWDLALRVADDRDRYEQWEYFVALFDESSDLSVLCRRD